jgi:hypothetical protein
MRGLSETAPFWPEIRTAYDWVHRAAHILGNSDDHDVDTIRREYQLLLDEISRRRDEIQSLSAEVDYFTKETASYLPSLFHCYEVSDLPKTNNDLEQYFGTARYLERRASGRTTASPAMVVRGSVRVVASVASRGCFFNGSELRPTDLGRWRKLRRELQYRHSARRAQLRFRRDPQVYLAKLEERLLQPSLPS